MHSMPNLPVPAAPGDVQELTRGGAKSTTFYCNAPGGILIEVSAFDA